MATYTTYTFTLDGLQANANIQREEFIHHLVEHGDITKEHGDQLLATTLIIVQRKGLLGTWWDHAFGYNSMPEKIGWRTIRVKQPSPDKDIK